MDERAFRDLIDPYRGALEVHCYRMLGSLHDAEDVVQETLLRAWNGMERFEGRASVRTWLYRIATNACLDEIERRPRRPVPVEPFPDHRLEAPAADPAARYALHEGMELALLAAIQLLPGRQRAILILRDVLGWTGPEVAELLDTTTTATNSALQRARETIDAELPEPGGRTAAGPRASALLARYVDFWSRQDVDGLVALLHEDAVLRMPPQPSVHGARAIVAFFAERMAGLRLTPVTANHRPAVLMHHADGTPHGVLAFDVGADGSALAAVDAYISADLVRRFER